MGLTFLVPGLSLLPRGGSAGHSASGAPSGVLMASASDPVGHLLLREAANSVSSIGQGGGSQEG